MNRFIYLLIVASIFSCKKQLVEEKKKPNILFIAIDDLRPELGSYGSEIAISPNLDKLASEGFQFNNAYCQQAICGPSRASVLTGMRPETSGIIHNYIKIRDTLPDIVTLPQHFKENGYEAVYAGKIFHHGDKDDEHSWSKVLTVAKDSLKKGLGIKGFALPQNKKRQHAVRKEMFAKYGDLAKYGLAMGPAYEAADVPDNTYIDGYNTDLAINELRELSKSKDKPFFLALGMNKPHLNWNAPKKYWDLYKTAKIKHAIENQAPENGAAMGLHPSFELRVRDGIPKKGALSDSLRTTLKHAYLACVSYVDAQIGRMITALDDAGVRDNTIIIVWSDHGYHLGDMGIWGKATNYEIATRVPLLIWTPNMSKGSQGKTTDALVELVDLYPTLSELAGIKIPKHVEGSSFKPLLENPDLKWKSAAFSQFPSPALREWGAFPIRPSMRETYFGPLLEEVETHIIKQQDAQWNRDLFENNLMGYAMRTKRYRLVVWKDRSAPEKEPVFIELFDHKTDPKETKNCIEDHPEVVARLMAQFKMGWRGNQPKKSK